MQGEQLAADGGLGRLRDAMKQASWAELGAGMGTCCAMFVKVKQLHVRKQK